jgi:hypothetical protein
MPAAHVYQILNHYTRREDLDPGFKVLDNSSNEQPDWYEYWPIRRFLLSESLDENAFYGFLSPKFRLKTNLTAAMVTEFIARVDADTDVCLFSPSIHNAAYFLNVFEHGESEHPGLKAVASRFFERIGHPSNLDELVSDSRNTVHSNYFIARPRFWRAWLEVNEQLFRIAGTSGDPLGVELSAPTEYRGSREVHMKIFVMERIATWLLTRDASFKARVRDPFAARSRIYKLPVAVVCDALKIAYTTERRGQYKDVFLMVRKLKGPLNLLVRLGGKLGFSRVRPSLRVLEAYWRPGAR